MGRDITTANFAPTQFAAFRSLLRPQRDIAMQRLLDPSDPWRNNPGKIGSETEGAVVYIRTGHAAHIAPDVLPHAAGWEAELGPWNLEFNGGVHLLAGEPFTKLLRELRVAIRQITPLLKQHGATFGLFGVLPSLTEHDIASIMVRERFVALSAQFDASHGPCNIEFNVPGFEELRLTGSGIGYEALTTTRQIHETVSSAVIRESLNASALIASVLAGSGGYSPYVLGNKVCRSDGRLIVFPGSIRNRGGELGTGWLENPWDSIDQALLEPVLLPELSDQPPAKLAELTLHIGTVYPAAARIVLAKDHIRKETRVRPAGPSPIDTISDDALTIALGRYVQQHIARWIEGGLLFKVAQANYAAAIRFGTTAEIWWPNKEGKLYATTPAGVIRDLAEALRNELIAGDVDQSEATWALGPVVRRAWRNFTPADWLIAAAERLPEDNRMGRLTLAAIEAANSGYPIVDWPLP